MKPCWPSIAGVLTGAALAVVLHMAPLLPAQAQDPDELVTVKRSDVVKLVELVQAAIGYIEELEAQIEKLQKEKEAWKIGSNCT